eukprot:CAMPEP_0119013036 /NCGR_PEP_ID=MMETSP1176-20130426/7772_1 /TAXON_ID=265551 /ORGANISM="Synedropsis recta cf, Strain CCMP1620" /LENGTH=89 /DNA_ID=CAMNT_0006966085 /DNA_START=50 /DNA_END=319 /DNA_ORIENTATION=+
MVSIVEKLITPSWYRGQATSLVSNAAAYYRPLARAGSITPLWHGMMAVGTIMYISTQFAHKQTAVQGHRQIEKKALAEYYEKHGMPHAH